MPETDGERMKLSDFSDKGHNTQYKITIGVLTVDDILDSIAIVPLKLY